ncbi:unnamed protein product, partial [Ectocarpus fasciculatus]
HHPLVATESLLNDGENIQVRRNFEAMLRNAQTNICSDIEKIDGRGKFKADSWKRPGGGGGVSMVLSDGAVFEKAGVNLAVVYGTMPAEALKAATEGGFDRRGGRKAGEDVPFFACGLSSVMHPKNPFCPTMHFNYRYFEVDGQTWWFGGGTDITPAYLDENDIRHFHGTYKRVCDKHDPQFYTRFKAWADDYFRIVHRNENRGLGGIFYDDLRDRSPNDLTNFAKECLAAVVPSYGPIIEKHKADPYTAQQKAWQLLRRGRYVEFNLIYDRGTIFGLKTGGRIESILMSLPKLASWEYNHSPAPGSPEDELLDACKKPRAWV